LLEIIKPEFTASTWRAFEHSALQNRPSGEVGAELGMTANAVCIARSRVLRRLREEAKGLVVE
jgi:RNA polymerase sigma-70 factor (ECF subfamily)